MIYLLPDHTYLLPSQFVNIKNNVNAIMTTQVCQIDNGCLFDEDLAQRREDECLALEAILPQDQISIRNGRQDGVAKTSSLPSILFTIPISFDEPKRVRIRSHLISNEEKEGDNLNDLSTSIEKMSIHSTPLRNKNSSQAQQRSVPTKRAEGKKVERESLSSNNRSPNNKSQDWIETIEETVLENILHLPPVRALVKLPNGYPDKEPPRIAYISSDFIGKVSVQGDQVAFIQPQRRSIFSIASTQAAMSRANMIKQLKTSLLNAWEEMSGEVLYYWYEMLRESLWGGEDSILKDELHKNDILLHEYVVPGQDNSTTRLSTIVRTNDILCKRKNFEGERYGCGICLEDVRGGKCWKLSCKHIFCQHCLTEYVSRSITDGYPRQATACPDPECVKLRVKAENAAESTSIPVNNEKSSFQLYNLNENSVGIITEDEIVSLVGKNLLQRLHDLQEKALALRDPTFGFCPRPGCEQLVHGDPKDVGTAYEAMRQCAACSYAYCVYCSKSWHYGNPCNIVSNTALIEAYQKTTEGSTERKMMEMKYGKSNLERMVRTFEEERSNRAWIEANTQRCPCCHVPITKNFGCNHMICKACNTHFCYRCGTRLPPNEPYKHFNTPGISCYMKLFDADMMDAGGWEPIIGADEINAWEADNL